jgi:hypothetical protein
VRRLFWRHTLSHFATLAVPKHSPPACRICQRPEALAPDAVKECPCKGRSPYRPSSRPLKTLKRSASHRLGTPRPAFPTAFRSNAPTL